MNPVPMKIKLEKDGKLPTYATTGSSGMDIYSASSVSIDPGTSKVLPTGISVEIPEGYELQVRPRSGLAAKHNITVLNTPGTIDSDYRGEIGVTLINHGRLAYIVEEGDRIAQIVPQKVEKIEWEVVEGTSKTERGEGGFGSTNY